MWLRTNQIIPTPGTSDTTVIAMTSPISVWKVNSALIAIVMGLPPVTVRMRAKTTSTQLKMKQKKAATPMPGAISGIRRVTTKAGSDCPSMKAVSSNSLGIALMKLSRIQIAMAG